MQFEVLATDLDGTFIPLDGEHQSQNQRDLLEIDRELKRCNAQLVYVTGRHLDSVLEAMQQYQLPQPAWIVCNVGTEIYRIDANTNASPLLTRAQFELSVGYAKELRGLLGNWSVTSLWEALTDVSGLRRQEEAKQSEFKLSFYADMQHSERLLKELQEILDRQAAPFSLISSQDPFTGDGLIDFLPQGVSKAYAVDWWAKSLGCNRDAIIYAGDSGNDLAVFASGVRSILVGNTDAGVVAQTRGIHAAQGWQNRLYHASNCATSGVLEGLQSFCAS